MVEETDIEHLRVGTRGTTLHVAAAGPVDGTPVVLLHGFPEAWFAWRRQIPHLAALGYRVLAPDQRGYNLSGKPRGRRAYTLDKLSGDILDLLDYAGVERGLVVGHDWGAVVTWWLAMHHPDRLARVTVLNAPHPVEMMRAVVKDKHQRKKSAYMLWFQLPRLGERALLKSGGGILRRTSRPGAFSDEDLARYVEAWRQPGAATAMLNWYRAMPFDRPRRAHVTVPTLLLWGARDHVLGPELARASLSRCAAGRLELLDDATHWLHHDEPERVNEALARWLADEPAAASSPA